MSLPRKYGVTIKLNRTVVTPEMFSRLVLRTEGGYIWIQKSGAENTWISNGWMGECTFEYLIETYGPVVIVNPNNESNQKLPMITKDGYLVEPL